MWTELMTSPAPVPARPEALSSEAAGGSKLGAAHWATQPCAHNLPAGSWTLGFGIRKGTKTALRSHLALSLSLDKIIDKAATNQVSFPLPDRIPPRSQCLLSASCVPSTQRCRRWGDGRGLRAIRGCTAAENWKIIIKFTNQQNCCFLPPMLTI